MSVPANIPLNIRIVEQHIDSSVVQLNVSWSTSSPWPTHVELVIGSTLANPVHTVTVEVQLHSAVVQVTNSSNDYLWVSGDDHYHGLIDCFRREVCKIPLLAAGAIQCRYKVHLTVVLLIVLIVQKNHQKGMDDIEERLDELEEK